MVAQSPINMHQGPRSNNNLREIMEEARSMNETESVSHREKELSFYALDIENIDELIRS